jgi:acyl-CoA synthetase (AMP-forming)/AMP-acid ligase II
MVVACVALTATGVRWQDFDAHCRASPLARYKKPRAYLMMESLPRNAANKVLRPNLREAVTTERASGKVDRLHLVDG